MNSATATLPFFLLAVYQALYTVDDFLTENETSERPRLILAGLTHHNLQVLPGIPNFVSVYSGYFKAFLSVP